MTVCMPGCKPNGLQLWFSPNDGGSGLRLNDGPDVNFNRLVGA